MSVSVLLIPVMVAAVGGTLGTATAGAAVLGFGRGEGEDAPHTLRVETRMRDTGILVRALEHLGAKIGTVEEHLVTAEVGDLQLDMTRDASGVWAAHLDAVGREATVAEANELMLEVDRAYGLMVQQAVVERINAQAEASGMRVAEQTTEKDASVRIVLDVLRQGVGG